MRTAPRPLPVGVCGKGKRCFRQMETTVAAAARTKQVRCRSWWWLAPRRSAWMRYGCQFHLIEAPRLYRTSRTRNCAGIGQCLAIIRCMLSPAICIFLDTLALFCFQAHEPCLLHEDQAGTLRILHGAAACRCDRTRVLALAALRACVQVYVPRACSVARSPKANTSVLPQPSASATVSL